MLYRKPRLSVLTIARTVAHRVLATLGEMNRSGKDAACLDGLRPEQLQDLGIQRIESRDVRFYR